MPSRGHRFAAGITKIFVDDITKQVSKNTVKNGIIGGLADHHVIYSKIVWK